ncbi:MAG TPA: TIGR03435 family protein [Bryobacteraceae bacterium]|nr:TIGR03435 family protein [Bryobacteraceae bacterium]
MMRLALAGLMALGLLGQERISFEVASVKPTANGGDMRPMRQAYSPGGQLTITNMPLYWLIATAYDLPFQSKRLTGAPAWAYSERFDIQAIAPEPPAAGTSAAAREARTRLMLRALLAERFGLVIRREMRDLPVYAMVAAKGGPKLTRAVIDEKDCPERPGDSGLYCHHPDGGMQSGIHGAAIDMNDVASLLESWMDRPVLDQTGIKGLYNVRTTGWAPLTALAPGQNAPTGTENIADPEKPSVFRVFEEQLGLKLEPKKAQVEIYVIGRVQRPGEN